MGLDRATIAKSLHRLAAVGCIEIESDFGYNRKGTLRVVIYDKLVKLSAKQIEMRKTPQMDRGPFVDGSGTICGPFEGDSLESPQIPCPEDSRSRKEGAEGRRFRGSEEEGNIEVAPRPLDDEHDDSLFAESADDEGPIDVEVARCGECSQPIEGHDYGDHEPVLARLSTTIDVTVTE